MYLTLGVHTDVVIRAAGGPRGTRHGGSDRTARVSGHEPSSGCGVWAASPPTLRGPMAPDPPRGQLAELMLLAGRRWAARSPAAAAWGGLRAYPSPRKTPILSYYRQKSSAKFLFYKDLRVSAPPGGSGLAEPIHRALSGRGGPAQTNHLRPHPMPASPKARARWREPSAQASYVVLA